MKQKEGRALIIAWVHMRLSAWENSSICTPINYRRREVNKQHVTCICKPLQQDLRTMYQHRHAQV